MPPARTPRLGGETAIRTSAAAPAPLIAVTTSEIRQTPEKLTPQGDPPQAEMALGLKYLKAIERAGGVPVVVPPLTDRTLLSSLLDRVSGVCLTGGPDLDPVAYGQRRHEMIGPTWRELDACELALAELADLRDLPVLGICRGAQAINVARGGSLHQHIADSYGERIGHRQRESAKQPTHWVNFTGTGSLSRIMGCQRTRVNSFHHQAVDRLGRGLRITGRSPDGVVESFEALDRTFVIGVQWHVEGLVARPRQAKLFRAFTEAARSYETRFRIQAA
jgi:putative glutamine amidotransferase